MVNSDLISNFELSIKVYFPQPSNFRIPLVKMCGSVPVRTSSDQLYRLKKFTLRLFYASDIRQPNVEVCIFGSVEYDIN